MKSKKETESGTIRNTAEEMWESKRCMGESRNSWLVCNCIMWLFSSLAFDILTLPTIVIVVFQGPKLHK